MISIKCRVLIKTVQLYSISNMTIKIAAECVSGGASWIGDSVVFEFTLMEMYTSRKI